MRKISRVVDPAKINQLEFSVEACVRRSAESGLSLAPIGSIGSKRRVGVSASVLVYNGGGSVAFVRFGDDAIGVSTGPADGIPVLPGEKCVLNSGQSEYVIASSNAVYGYVSE